MNTKKTFKVLILGEAGVGKTSLVRRYTAGTFSSRTTTTVGVDRTMSGVEVDDESFSFNILDAAGTFGYRGIIKSYMTNIDAVIFVYDLTDKESFASLPLWNTLLKNSGKKDVTKVLVGNKKDLVDRREVLFKNAKNYAEFEQMVAMEISVKEEDSVDLVFQCVARELRLKKQIAEMTSTIVTKKRPFFRTASLNYLSDAEKEQPKRLLHTLGMFLSRNRRPTEEKKETTAWKSTELIQKETFRWM